MLFGKRGITSWSSFHWLRQYFSSLLHYPSLLCSKNCLEACFQFTCVLFWVLILTNRLYGTLPTSRLPSSNVQICCFLFFSSLSLFFSFAIESMAVVLCRLVLRVVTWRFGASQWFNVVNPELPSWNVYRKCRHRYWLLTSLEALTTNRDVFRPKRDRISRGWKHTVGK